MLSCPETRASIAHEFGNYNKLNHININNNKLYYAKLKLKFVYQTTEVKFHPNG